MPDQDDPDVIEHEPRRVTLPKVPWLPGGSRPAAFAAVVIGCALLAVAGTLAALRLTSSRPPGQDLAGLVTEVTTVPVGPPAAASLPVTGTGGLLPTTPPPPGTAGYGSTLLIDGVPASVKGPPLTEAGRPEVLYVYTGYCPYCAEENWALIVALSRFGKFAGLTTTRSPRFEGIAPIDTWTFRGSSYTSPYLAFVPVETFSSALVSPTADKEKAASYRALQPLTPAEQADSSKYDTTGSTPFIDFANRIAQTGTGMQASLLAGETWQQIAAALRQPKTPLGATLLREAAGLTGVLCSLTGGRPATACPPPD